MNENKNLICILCLKTSEGGLSIGESPDILIKIEKILQFKVHDSSNWPSQICQDCFIELNKFWNFFTACNNNQIVLTSLFGQCILKESESKQSEEKVKEEESRSGNESVDGEEWFENPIIYDDADDNEFLESDGKSNLKVEEESPPPRKRRKRNSSPKPEEGSDNVESAKLLDQQPHKGEDMDETIRSFNKLVCEFCPEHNFNTFHEVVEHYRDTHDMEGYVECCGMKFTRRYKIHNHLEKHLNPNLFKCELCPKTFETRYGLKHHKEWHLPDDLKKYQCQQCSSKFFRLAKLKHHIANTHVPEEKKTYQCSACQKLFVTKYAMEDHYKKIHEQLRNFVCEICAKKFKTKQNLIDHLATHDPKRQRVKCDLCGKLYQNELQLKRHKKRIHTTGEVSKCPQCGIIAKNQFSLTAHINLAHKIDPNRHQCTFCGKGFKKTKTLREHMASHTGEKLYSCLFCKTEFNSSANKYKHQKLKHPIEYEAMKKERESKMFEESNN